MPSKLPSRLAKSRHGTNFVFRFAIPRDLRTRIGRNEVRLSLRTEVKLEAIIASHRLAAQLPALFSHLRSMSADPDPTETVSYFKQWLELARVNSALRTKVEELECSIEVLQRSLMLQRAEMEGMVGLDRAKSFVKQAHTVGQLKGHREVESLLVFPWPPERTKMLSELLDSYLAHFTYRAPGAYKKPLGAKTLEMYEADIRTYLTVMGDIRIGDIDRDHAGKYFNILRKLPPNMSRLAKFKGKTLPQILAMKEAPQSEYNASKKMERLGGMYKWALKEKRKWGIDDNPFEGYSQDGKTKSQRRPFTTEEWLKLLGHPSFEKRAFARSYMYWLIPLAAYTGARLGELAQLDIKDFVVVENVACIDINDDEASETDVAAGKRKKRVKTHNAKRLVPIHSKLVALGLLRYVELMRQAGQRYFFPELSRDRRDGPAHAASNWFQRFRADVGVSEKQVTVFHSMRHGFITTLLDLGVAPHTIAPIVGHEGELITDRVYWNLKNATARVPTVEAFSLPTQVANLLPAFEVVRLPRLRAAKA